MVQNDTGKFDEIGNTHSHIHQDSDNHEYTDIRPGEWVTVHFNDEDDSIHGSNISEIAIITRVNYHTVWVKYADKEIGCITDSDCTKMK